VRVRASPDGARIDVRSASRWGRFDFGSNAARIKSLVDDIETLADTLVKEPKAPPKAPPAKPAPAGQPTAKR
jgi:hypothetical protein